MELKKIKIMSLAKIAGLFGIIYGLLSGIVFSLVYSKADTIAGLSEQLGIISQLGYSSIIVLPILNGVIYFIAGIVLAFVYNILAKKFGGVELEFKK